MAKPLHPYISASSSECSIKILNPIATRVRETLKTHNIPFKANDNIAHGLKLAQVNKEDLIKEVEGAFQAVLHNLCIDYDNDHNSKETAKRYAKMVINETFAGRFDEAPNITVFPNVSNNDQLIIVRDIKIESVCSHHHQNISGVCHIAVLPDPEGNVMGLSKYARIAHWIARRPQIQEELNVGIAEALQEMLQPRGVAVIINAKHYCMACRGVEEPNSTTITSHITGAFRDNPALRAELYSLLNMG